MYTYKISGEENKKSLLLDEFKAIDDKYTLKNTSDIKKLELERLPDVQFNDEKITATAQDSLAGYRNTNLAKIEKTYGEGIEKLNAKGEASTLGTLAKKSGVEESLNAQKTKEENNLFARGLGRSSIIINNRKAFDEAKLKEYSELDSALSREIGLLEKERELLLEQKNAALRSFDIAYAGKLTEKINSITSELTKQQETVQKYNNDIAKKEADYEAKQLEEQNKHNQTLSQIIDKNGIFAIDVLKQRDKYNKALEYFNGMSAEDAILELKNNSAYKTELGDKFDPLLKEMWERL